MFRCIENVKRAVGAALLASTIIVLAAGCGAQPGSFTTKAYQMDQRGRSVWVDSQLREVVGKLENIEKIKESHMLIPFLFFQSAPGLVGGFV